MRALQALNRFTQRALAPLKRKIASPFFDCRQPLSLEECRAFLERERSKADRSGSFFSLVTFPLLYASDNGHQCITSFCAKHLRITDEIGWVDQNQLGLFLFETTKQGTLRFIQRLRTEPNTPVNIDGFSVYSYPEDSEGIFGDKEVKRSRRRLDVELKAYISWPENKTQVQDVSLSTKNLSASGAFLLTESPLHVGEEITIDLSLPLEYLRGIGTDNVHIKAQGKIVRTEENGMAVSFNTSYIISPLLDSSSSIVDISKTK